MDKRIVILDIVGLSPSLIQNKDYCPNINNMVNTKGLIKVKPSFPSVTCTVQASITTGKYPVSHGVISNGVYNRLNREVNFWQRHNSLLDDERVFNIIRKSNSNITSSVLFFQNSVYCGADYVVTPAPIHNHDGSMTQWCYSKPAGLYDELVTAIGSPFNLMSFWGPMASFDSSRWIFDAGMYLLRKSAPNLNYIYIPHLDYSSQKFGPFSPQTLDGLRMVDGLVGELRDYARKNGIGIILISEYGLVPVNRSVALNRVLRDHGLLKTILIDGKEYLDFENSGAFAMVDHQIAHIYINDASENDIKQLLTGISGVGFILDSSSKKEYNINHQRSGDLIAVADRDCWFSYYWWNDDDMAPSFTRTVDIHRKPGYDPLELFFDPKVKGIPYNTDLIKGSHGRPAETDDELAVFIADIGDVSGNHFFDSAPSMINDIDIAKVVLNLYK